MEERGAGDRFILSRQFYKQKDSPITPTETKNPLQKSVRKLLTYDNPPNYYTITEITLIWRV